MENIFLSENIRIKQSLKASPYCVVTFDSYTDTGDLDREAFGERFFRERDISVVHVLNGRNNWYHTSEWTHAMAVVRRATARYQRTISYGSSMGGYAAMRFAEFIGATAIVAISPQYSMEPGRAPFENRWQRDARKVCWRSELAHPFSPDIPAIIVYDPRLRNDRLHAECIAREAPVTHLKVPFSGHPSGTCLAECGLLGPLIMGAVHGEECAADISRRARASRRESLSFYSTLAGVASRRRPKLATVFARKATDLGPGVYYAWIGLGYVLHRAGCSAEAVAAMRRAFELAPDQPAVITALGHALAYDGQMANAFHLLKRASRMSGRPNGLFHALAIWLLLRAQFARQRRRFTSTLLGQSR